MIQKDIQKKKKSRFKVSQTKNSFSIDIVKSIISSDYDIICNCVYGIIHYSILIN